MNRFVLCVVVTLLGVGFGFTEEKEKKKPTDAEIKKAKLDIELWEKVVATYHIKNSKPPKELADAKHYIDLKMNTDPFTSPWGAKYEYDPDGPKNGGKKPDIWVKTPDGEIIGNFPEPKKKDAEKPKEK